MKRKTPQTVSGKPTGRNLSKQGFAYGAISLLALTLSASGATLAIVNGGFDTGTDGSSTITGWTTTAGATGFWLEADGSAFGDPAAPQSGSFYLSADRQAGGAGSQPTSSTLSQTVTLDPVNLALVAGGSAELQLGFYYADGDPNDQGTITVTFLDSTSATISSLTTGVLVDGAPWTLAGVNGAVPTNTESVRIDIITNRLAASATNLGFDSFSAEIVPEPSIALLSGLGMLGLLRRRR